MLTDERILHIQDTHVGGPTPLIPLDVSDWIDFARAIESAATAPLLAQIEQLEALVKTLEMQSLASIEELNKRVSRIAELERPLAEVKNKA